MKHRFQEQKVSNKRTTDPGYRDVVNPIQSRHYESIMETEHTESCVFR